MVDFGKEFEDDGFDGSAFEHQILTEVLFGNNTTSNTSNTSNSKKMEISFGSTSNTSALTNQKDDSLEKPKDLTVSTSSEANREVNVPVVEYSGYLLNQNIKINRVSKFPEKEIPESYENDEKGIISPVSQESNMNKTPKTAKPRWRDSCFIELDETELTMVKESKNDPRPLLRYHIHQLLRTSGWVIGRRKRDSNLNGEYVYKSPQGKPMREFHRAWISCGEHLLFYANNLVQTNDVKVWRNMTQFMSDLTSTVSEIEEQLVNMESTEALMRTWCLLDPFANVVFIDKTIRLLKRGKSVKGKRSFINENKTSKVSEEDPGPTNKESVNEGTQLATTSNNSIVCEESSEKLSEVPITLENTKISLGECEIEADDLPLSYYRSKKSKRKFTSSELSENLKRKRFGIDRESEKNKTCILEDDDLLISAIIKHKGFETSKPLRKRKSQKNSCKLVLRRGKQSKWSGFGSRTVLSWLIHSGVVSINEVIQYRNPKDYRVIKDGLITWEGIICKCCDNLLSVTEFKSHAGFKRNRPCLHLFTESGKPWTLCQLEAWSSEYKTRKGPTLTGVRSDEHDQNDDSCGRCGYGGELICCDNCPSTFHLACLYTQDLPVGSWYCSQCTCKICKDVVNENEGFKCSQCENKYHKACVGPEQAKDILSTDSDTWFCGKSCHEIYEGLQSRIGLENIVSEGYTWSLLRCIHGDKKVHTAQKFVALKAECNSKLAVAITIMEECFVSMVDQRTGIDMIPHVVYNWGSKFARLNYHGFYTVVLQKDDVIACVASIRIHGVKLAEMPLIATCSNYRRQGMCKRLMNSIEEMLRFLKVEKFVISAIPELVETWTNGFGFSALEEDEKREMSDVSMMIFPGSVWLKKDLYGNES